MDLRAVWTGASNDIALLAGEGLSGWVVLALLLGLPAASLVAIARGNRLAVVPLGISGAVAAVWVLHHTTGWWDTSLAWSVAPLVAVGAGWCILLVAVGRSPRTRRVAV